MDAAMTTYEPFSCSAPDLFFGQSTRQGGISSCKLAGRKAATTCFAIVSCSVMASMFLWSHSTAR